MGMDQDYPMSGAQRKILVIGLAILIGIGVTLFGGFIPGVKPDFSLGGITSFNGTQYYYEPVYLFGPLWPGNQTSPEAFVFHNVTFHLWVTNWYGFSGGVVRGNGTEPNGTVYPFALGHLTNPPVNQSIYFSPDGLFAVSWRGGVWGGPTVGLFVKV